MDFEPFAPIDLPIKGKEKKKEDREKLLKEEIEKLKRENLELKNFIEKLKFSALSEKQRYEEEKRRLLATLEELKKESENLKGLVENLKTALEDREQKLQYLQELYKKLETKIVRNLETQKEEILNLSLKVLIETVKKLLHTDKLQNEEVLKRIFEEIFSEKIFLGELTIKANPQDVELIRSILQNNEKVVFDIIPTETLKRGEIEVETERFFVERKLDELAEEFAEEFLRRFSEERSEGNKRDS